MRSPGVASQRSVELSPISFECPHTAMTLLDQPLPRAAPAATLKPLASTQADRSALIWTHVAVLMTALAAFSLWLAGGAVVPWDSKNHFYPMFRFLGDALANGTIPLWNPYHFGGHPSVADPQSLIFTPSMALFARIAPRASMQIFDAVIFAHLVMGGIFVLAIGRARRLEPAAGVLAAMIFILGGAASSRLQHTGMIISYAFFSCRVLGTGARAGARKNPRCHLVWSVRCADGAGARSGRVSVCARADRARCRSLCRRR